jgi:hypothetical protein
MGCKYSMNILYISLLRKSYYDDIYSFYYLIKCTNGCNKMI